MIFDYTLNVVLFGVVALGALCGISGTFAVLRKRSLMGDAVAHATLPGVCLMFLLTGTREASVLLIGAALTGWLAMTMMSAIVRYTRISEDGALGIVLSVFFGFGIVLLSVIQRLPGAQKSGLDSFLFGQAAALLRSDVIILACALCVTVAIVALTWKELKVFSFDPDFADSLGIQPKLLDALVVALVVGVIVLGLQAVGVVLVSALLVAPAAAARQWSDRLEFVVVLAAIFGAFSGAVGTLISATQTKLATGPTIVLTMGVIVAFSLAFAPGRGMVWTWFANRQRNRSLKTDAVLLDLYELAEQHADSTHPHAQQVLRTMGRGPEVISTLQYLQEEGLVEPVGADDWGLTTLGVDKAAAILLQYGLRQNHAEL